MLGFLEGWGGSANFIFMGVGLFPKKKIRRLHEPFREVRADFCLLPCDTSQEPSGNCSEKLVQMNIVFWVNFIGWTFLLNQKPKHYLHKEFRDSLYKLSPLLPLKASRKQAERVCPNCAFIGWVFLGYTRRGSYSAKGRVSAF